MGQRRAVSPQFFNSARFDAFDRWVDGAARQRRGHGAVGAVPSCRFATYGGALDRYGAWNYEAPYGYVWYPTVAPDWRPYYDGYWSPVPIVWVDVDRRRRLVVADPPLRSVGLRAQPLVLDSRSHWAPAWVSWGGAPGYVSWCPLGFDNRAVFPLALATGSGYSGWNGWNGWTVVSRDHFGGHRSVRQFAVGPRSLPANVGFVQQASVPVAPPRAVPRRSGNNTGQIAGEQRQFPTVIGRTGESGQDIAVPRRGADRPAEGQVIREGRPTTITPPVPRAVPPSNDGQNRGFYRTRPPDATTVTPTAPYEKRSNPARPRYERPSIPPTPAQPIVPSTPQRSERSQYGTAMPRSAPIQPPQPVQPNAQPGFSRRPGAPFYTERPTTPPVTSTPPPQVPQRQPAPQREERASPPPQERQNDQGRSRGRENQQSSGSDGQQNGGGGHHRR